MGGYGGMIFFGGFIKKYDCDKDESFLNQYSNGYKEKKPIVVYLPYDGSGNGNMYLIIPKTMRTSEYDEDYLIPPISEDLKQNLEVFANKNTIPITNIGWYFVKDEIY